MPSRQSQQVKIVNLKNKKTGQNRYVMVAKKTGFIDVTIANKRYYYNASLTNQSMTQKNIAQQFINQNTPNKKKTIVISRKM